ncbi:MAG TPA: hypothetical protein VFD49_13605 [Candidatus Dormibacteraeota bacterium]|jgi:hypothetical protein|nr:hypothetical protein [Candidatus Dormibacteraeota bacterium]
MRTLATQMRLRRALRVQAEYQRRLAREGPASLSQAASTRLLQLLREVRVGWDAEAQPPAPVRAFVSRSLAAMEAAAAAMARPGADLADLGSEFRETGMALVLFLRGLDEAPPAVLAELVGEPLTRSA